MKKNTFISHRRQRMCVSTHKKHGKISVIMSKERLSILFVFESHFLKAQRSMMCAGMRAVALWWQFWQKYLPV